MLLDPRRCTSSIDTISRSNFYFFPPHRQTMQVIIADTKWLLMGIN